MTLDREQLVRYLDEFLASPAQKDYGPNGLQIEGRREVRRVVTGVSACLALHEEAVRQAADAVLVHHGVFWHSAPATLTGHFLRRVAPLLRHGISLIAYHLPLDRHPEIGNNALAARGLGLEDLQPFAPHEGLPVGIRGTFPVPRSVTEIASECLTLFGRPALHFAGGPAEIRTLGVVTGGGQDEVHRAIEAGLDAYVTGEASEWTMNLAREAGIHFFAAGHHATERLGVRALGDHLARRFDLEVRFFDVPNPV